MVHYFNIILKPSDRCGIQIPWLGLGVTDLWFGGCTTSTRDGWRCFCHGSGRGRHLWFQLTGQVLGHRSASSQEVHSCSGIYLPRFEQLHNSDRWILGSELTEHKGTLCPLMSKQIWSFPKQNNTIFPRKKAYVNTKPVSIVGFNSKRVLFWGGSIGSGVGERDLLSMIPGWVSANDTSCESGTATTDAPGTALWFCGVASARALCTLEWDMGWRGIGSHGFFLKLLEYIDYIGI